jgi:hypothetical protein
MYISGRVLLAQLTLSGVSAEGLSATGVGQPPSQINDRCFCFGKGDRIRLTGIQLFLLTKQTNINAKRTPNYFSLPLLRGDELYGVGSWSRTMQSLQNQRG